METGTTVIILVIAVALLFDFANGWNDAANAIATVVSTRVLSPFAAIMLATVCNFAGALLSTRVAKMIGGGIVDPANVTPVVVLSAMLAATIWISLLTRMGLPISGSHSLIGGLVGSVVAFDGVGVLKGDGLMTILIALLVSPIVGLGLGLGVMTVLGAVFRDHRPTRLNRRFGRLQLLSAGGMAVSHGTNDAQKVMGVITLALASAGWQDGLEVQLWVILLCAGAMAAGTAAGGWGVIRTLGMGLLKLKPVHGFAAETSAVAVLFSAAGLGVPVSTTHVITGSIMGVGAANRLSAVRWGIGQKILYAWVFTLPTCALFGALLHLVLSLWLPE